MLTRQETRKDAAFSLAYGQKIAKRDKKEQLSIEDEECEERLDRAVSFMFKAVRFRSLASNSSNDTAKRQRSGAASVDEEKHEEEEEKGLSGHASIAERSKRIAPVISFNDGPTVDPDGVTNSNRPEERSERP